MTPALYSDDLPEVAAIPEITDCATKPNLQKPIPESKIKKIERQLNNRPRKCLGSQTPAEVFDML